MEKLYAPHHQYHQFRCRHATRPRRHIRYLNPPHFHGQIHQSARLAKNALILEAKPSISRVPKLLLKPWQTN
ncbi:hypothetical protein [Rubritalea tangerina]|uniref:hypothetical protein n=1 Tax=Rubritalea tangerina TaxID=430798 RepID=UPI003616E2DA